MSEAYILVNDAKEQYVEPDNFLPIHDDEGNIATYTGAELDVVTAVNFIDWATGNTAWVAAYLIADTPSSRINETLGDLFGAWCGDAIRLVGGVTGEHDTIEDEYTNISRKLYIEVSQTETDLPPANTK